jgi:hypothetical protein
MGAFRIDVPKLFRLWHSNMTNEAICAELGVVASTFSRLGRVYGLKPRTHIRARFHQKDDPTIEEIMERAAAIRESWSPAEERRRRVGESQGRVELANYVYCGGEFLASD